MSLVKVRPAMIAGLAQPNLLDNTDYEIAQRGTSRTGVGSQEYLLDRWKVNPSGATLDVSRGSFTPGDLAAADEAGVRYYLSVEATAGDDTWGPFHLVPDVTLAGEGPVTLSGWVRMTGTSGGLEITLQRDFGAGGSATENTARTLNGLADGVWTYVEETFDLTLSGRTAGPSSYVGVYFLDPNNENGTIDLAMVKLEHGRAATPYRRRPDGVEWTRALRHYRQSYAEGTPPGTAVGASSLRIRKVGVNTSVINMNVRFDQPMHATPTVTVYSTDTGASGVIWQGSGTTGDVGAHASSLGPSGFAIVLDSAEPDSTVYLAHYSAEAEL